MVQNGIEWAAGLFEGEGSIVCYKLKNRKDSYRVLLSLSMSDKDVVERFTSIVGVGSFLGPYNGKTPTHKKRWQWQVANFKDCLEVVCALYPFLGERRAEKARELMFVCKERLNAKNK